MGPGDHYVLHIEDRTGHTAGCASLNLAKRLQLRRLFQETFIYASDDGSLTYDFLGSDALSTS